MKFGSNQFLKLATPFAQTWLNSFQVTNYKKLTDVAKNCEVLAASLPKLPLSAKPIPWKSLYDFHASRVHNSRILISPHLCHLCHTVRFISLILISTWQPLTTTTTQGRSQCGLPTQKFPKIHRLWESCTETQKIVVASISMHAKSLLMTWQLLIRLVQGSQWISLFQPVTCKIDALPRLTTAGFYVYSASEVTVKEVKKFHGVPEKKAWCTIASAYIIKSQNMSLSWQKGHACFLF